MKTRIALVSMMFMVLACVAPQAFAQQNLKLVTYNVHGGHGNLAVNLQRFRQLLDGDEHALCLQEIGPDIWNEVKAAFPEFPHAYEVWQQTTDPVQPWEPGPVVSGGAILSKLPIVWQNQRLVQIDPGGDLWERRAGFVRLQTGSTASDDVFVAFYHNTYNWDYDDFASEQQGMRRFRDIALQEMGASWLGVSPDATPYVLAGDFNLMEDKVRDILGDAPHHYGSWRDHIATNIPITATRRINTYELDISDHDAVVATMDHTVDVVDAPAAVAQHCDYGGYLVGLPVGSYSLAQLQALGILQDDISSITVQPGYRVELFEHHDFTGNVLTLTENVGCLVDYGWNDQASSIRVSFDGQGFDLTIQAEHSSSTNGTSTQGTTDAGGGQNVGWIDSGDWLAYGGISFPSGGSYTVQYRVASAVGGGRLSLDLNGGSILLGSLDIPNTGGWQSWTTISHTVSLPAAGTYDVGIFASTGGWNLNWFRITKD